MPTCILTLNWTDQGIRAVKQAPKRGKAAKELAKKLGVEVKQIYLTSGEHDLLRISKRGERRQIRARHWLTGKRPHQHHESLVRNRIP